jgi:hypothetical protein
MAARQPSNSETLVGASSDNQQQHNQTAQAMGNSDAAATHDSPATQYVLVRVLMGAKC